MKREVKTSKYHIVWTPKYRRSFLKGLIKQNVEKSLLAKAEKLDVKIENMEIMPDHVHVFISIKPSQCISDIVRHLKGYSSYITRKNLNLYRYKGFWCNSYFCESVGHISERTIKKYIDNQWKHYKLS